jgi:hypothetical protein
MTPARVLDCALADGLQVALLVTGKLRLTGKPTVIRRWKGPIADHREAITGIIRSRTRPGSKRERFPFAAEKLDELREFFPNARVEYAREGDDDTGQRLVDAGVPLSTIEPATMPAVGCECSACNPKPSALRRQQRQPGAAFGLDRRNHFKQTSTYRADGAEDRWPNTVKWLGSRRMPAVEDEEDDV